jgi:enamine deaminase RidA (YjgF/YER057c/UK114 family)
MSYLKGTGMKSVVHPSDLSKPEGVWSPVIVVDKPGKLAFLSGFVSRNLQGQVVGAGDIKAQTRQVCENLKSAITAAGGTLADLVSVNVYITDMTLFKEIHEVRREYFPTEPPTSTMVQITRLTDPDFMIEINAIAVLPN